MRRGRRVMAICHCLLNANAKVPPLATCPGATLGPILPLLEEGVGLAQLPCPETTILGLNRFGMTKEQYDQPAWRRMCREMLQASVDQLQAFARAGYELVGVVGVDGSPNCGVDRTCFGYRGGEIGAPESDIPGQLASLRMGAGSGVFIEELRTMLEARDLRLPFFSVDEEDPVRLRPSRG